MATQSLPFDCTQYPPALVQTVAAGAVRDAEGVTRFLDELAHAWRDTEAGLWLAKRPLRLPNEVLGGLGAALRLLAWESQGFQLHREVELPNGREAVLDAFRSITDAEAAVRNKQLPLRVFVLTCERFAWAGLIELGVEIALDPDDEELALEALADFLWSNRTLAN